jgi:hypothetical protein
MKKEIYVYGTAAVLCTVLIVCYGFTMEGFGSITGRQVQITPGPASGEYTRTPLDPETRIIYSVSPVFSVDIDFDYDVTELVTEVKRLLSVVDVCKKSIGIPFSLDEQMDNVMDCVVARKDPDWEVEYLGNNYYGFTVPAGELIPRYEPGMSRPAQEEVFYRFAVYIEPQEIQQVVPTPSSPVVPSPAVIPGYPALDPGYVEPSPATGPLPSEEPSEEPQDNTPPPCVGPLCITM